MKKRTHLGILSAVLAVGMALAGCGGGGSSSGGGGSEPASSSGGESSASSGGSGQAASGGTLEKILIATQTPLSGQQSNVGDSLKTGAEYALKLQQDEFKKMGFDLQLFPQDDQADPKQGVTNAEMLVSNPDVLGVVGHYNTGVSIPASAKYDSASLAMISPGSTGVQLTEEGRKAVHRICARDDQQGPKGAKYAMEKLGVKSVFFIHDKTAYGQGLADQAKATFEKGGVQVLGYDGITQGEKDYSAVLNQAVSKKPDMIYFGGIYPEGGILAKQARDKGFEGYFMGGDGLDSPELIKIAGAAAEGILYTSITGDISGTDDGKKWQEDYKAAMGKNAENYSVYGFDAMNVMLDGLKRAIEANGGKKPTREQVLEAVHSTKDFQGKFIKVTFDEKGDNEYADVFIWKVNNGKAEYVERVE
ncbi:branched-chain amino acid ABC transporter substrate-binding protein [Brevibacillus massiliensis]|uniref:branched-chain amino acid ABC transporter substrate-binding protein n=1 Tax=Brevibacillus massiliensis TaxID=1118054 RepID=UPI0002EC3E81|nr:branched-chain amino acid ABC transporter substrate-binding protein [Brevibacillus massiliensis]